MNEVSHRFFRRGAFKSVSELRLASVVVRQECAGQCAWIPGMCPDGACRFAQVFLMCIAPAGVPRHLLFDSLGRDERAMRMPPSCGLKLVVSSHPRHHRE